MRRIGLICASMVAMAAITVSAQNTSAEFCIQSDGGHAFIALNRNTGDYKFVRCGDGVAFGGTGQIRDDGCFIFVEDNRDTYKVNVTVNNCAQAAKVFVDVPAPTHINGAQVPQMQESFQDTNINNNYCGCDGAQAPPGGNGDPEFIGPPVEDGATSAAPESGPAESGPAESGPAESGPAESEAAAPIELIAQSNDGQAFVTFNRNTGDYKFVRCSDGVAFSGTGQVKIDGCFIFLEDNRGTYKVIVTVNTCQQAAKVFVEAPEPTNTATGVPIPSMSERFSDTDIGNSAAVCAANDGKVKEK